MNIMMMTPALPEPSDIGAKTMTRGGSGESFQTFLEKGQDAMGRHKDNLLGVKDTGRAGDGDSFSEALDLDDQVTIPGLLQQMMGLLQKQAEEIKTGPGEWVFSMPDSATLEEMAAAAGMSAGQVAQFLQGILGDAAQVSEAQIDLGKFMGDLADHFAQLDAETSVFGPDTDLPLFETFLAKMGVDTSALENIAGRVVTGGDQLDLKKLLSALQALSPEEATGAFQLSKLDIEQLQAALQRAGLPDGELVNDGRQVSMDLARLTEWLDQAITAIDNAKPQPAALEFLTRLEEVFSQAGFQGKGPGWNPVVQKSMEAVYGKLLEVVDLSAVQVQVADHSAAVDEPELPWLNLFADSLSGGDRVDLASRLVLAARPSQDGGLEFQLDGDLDFIDTLKDGTSAGGAAGMAGRIFADVLEAGEPIPVNRAAHVMEQQTLAQLSQAVMRGVRHNEHHLVLKLYPQELGEVKINLHVRDEQVAVSFTMENSRVKEILENNMQDFRDSMEQQGFKLANCFTSVDQQDKGDDGWRQFDFTAGKWQEKADVKISELAEGIIYRQVPADSRAGEIDMFI